MTQPSDSNVPSAEARARKAAQGSTSLLGEHVYLLKRTRKWWAVPVMIVLLVLGALFALSSTGVAPLIYTLF